MSLSFREIRYAKRFNKQAALKREAEQKLSVLSQLKTSPEIIFAPSFIGSAPVDILQMVADSMCIWMKNQFLKEELPA